MNLLRGAFSVPSRTMGISVVRGSEGPELSSWPAGSEGERLSGSGNNRQKTGVFHAHRAGTDE